MPQYRYQALNAAQQQVVGDISADNLSAALTQLTARGLVVQALGDVAAAAPSDSRESNVEQIAWQQQLAPVLERARELLPPLKAFAEELPPGRHRRQLELLTSTLARGNIAADDVTATLRTLPGYWIPLLSAATVSRDPGRILREFLKESQQAEELRWQWRRALAYPLLLLGIAATILVGFSFLVIPIFRDIFVGFGLRTPLPTTIILTIAEWITNGRILLVIVVALLIALGLYRATRWLSPSLREWWQDLFATWMGHSTAIARFTQFAADLSEAEINLGHALRLAGLATGSDSIRRAASRVAEGLQTSREKLPDKNRRLLTRTVHYALVSSTSNASRVRLLREISASHTERMRWRLSWVRGVVEPLAICLVGMIVGVTALALFLPLFNLLQALS